MITLTIVVGIAILCISLLLYKNIINPLGIYTVFLTLCTGLASLRLRGEYEASDFTYALILTSLLSFFFTYIFTYEITKVKTLSKDTEISRNGYRIIYLMAIFSFVYTAINFTQSIQMYISGMDMATVRGEILVGSDGTASNPIVYFIDYVINSGIRLALIFITVVEVFFGKKRDMKFISLVGLNVLMYAFTNGGRLILYDSLVIFLFCYFYWRRTNKLNKKYLKKYFFPVFLCLGAIFYLTYYITAERQSNVPFWEAIYSIFTIFVPLMDHTITMVNQSNDLTLGSVFFSGFLIPINTVLDFFQIPRIVDTNVINKYDVAFFDIGGGNVANAYTSHIFYFYLDGRIWGVIFGSMLFALAAGVIFKKLRFNQNNRNLVLYLFVVYLIFRTVVRWQFAQPSTIVALIILLFIFKRRKILNEMFK